MGWWSVWLPSPVTDGQQLNKQYDHNDFQVDVPDSIGVSQNNLIMYVWFVTLVTFYLVEIFTK
jgi:hypothetical protein